MDHLPRLTAIAVVLLAQLLALDVAHAQTCRVYQVGSLTTPSGAYTGPKANHSNIAGVAGEILAWCNAGADSYEGGGSSNLCVNLCSGGVPSRPTGSYSVTGTWPSSLSIRVDRDCPTGADPNQLVATLTASTDGRGCPTCPAAGTRESVTGLPENAPVGATNCVANLCEATVTGPARRIIMQGGNGIITTVTHTGRACASTPTATNPNAATTDAADSVSTPDGIVSQEPETGCGIVNGDRVCPQSLQEGCASFASGGSMCVVSGPGAVPDTTPPKPNKGASAPTEPADPTVTVEAGGKAVEYYSRGTNANSTAPTDTSGGAVGGDPKDPAGGSSGGGTGDGEGLEWGTASGGLGCDAPPTCSGQPVECAILRQEWMSRCPGDPGDAAALAAIEATTAEQGGLEAASGGSEVDIGSLDTDGGFAATCPPPITVTVFGTSLNMDIWAAGCQMAELFAPITLMLSFLLAGMLFVRGGV